MNRLTFALLREASAKRLPQFKNSFGELAHTLPDGSDWSPAQWLQAVVGELGEWAKLRVAYEAGEISYIEYEAKSRRELADVQIYFSIFCMRSLDELEHNRIGDDAAQVFMKLIAALGTYANDRKKFDRKDWDETQFVRRSQPELRNALDRLVDLLDGHYKPAPNLVLHPHAAGVVIEEAVFEKFNETSERVGAKTFIIQTDAGLSVI